MRIALAAILSLVSIAGHSALAAEVSSPTLKWLGTAGWEIQYGQSKILIDPFLTRRQSVVGEEWQTDEAAVLSVIETFGSGGTLRKGLT